jgi:hypothetical protein
MTKKITRVVLFLTVAFGVCGVAVFLFGAKPLGYLQARYDLARGHYRIKSYGLDPFLSYRDYYDTFQAHGIELVAVAGCVVDNFIIANVAAYNAVMREAIRDRFGIDIIAIPSNEQAQPSEGPLETDSPGREATI